MKAEDTDMSTDMGVGWPLIPFTRQSRLWAFRIDRKLYLRFGNGNYDEL